MEALLAGIGIKDYLYAAAIAALLGGFALYTHHERVIGANEALAPVAVLAEKSKVQVAVGTAVAETTEKTNAKDYDTAVARPVAPIGIVCYNPRSRDLPEADTLVAPGVGEPTIDTGAEERFDPSGPVLANDALAEAQIGYLQGRVHELEAQMRASP